MSYHIYTGEGIVLRERPLKEADLSLKILTRDLGLINATAVGLRKGNSKRRPPLTELSLAKISLVRGKKDWRVTSADLDTNLYRDLKGNKNLFLPLAKSLSLIEKLVQGEEKHSELFDLIKRFTIFAAHERVDDEEAKIFESILVARILSALGYLSKNNFSEKIFNDEISRELIQESEKENKDLILAINKGIRESGLVK